MRTLFLLALLAVPGAAACGDGGRPFARPQLALATSSFGPDGYAAALDGDGDALALAPHGLGVISVWAAGTSAATVDAVDLESTPEDAFRLSTNPLLPVTLGDQHHELRTFEIDVARADGLAPGTPASGTVTIRAAGAQPLVVDLATTPPAPALAVAPVTFPWVAAGESVDQPIDVVNGGDAPLAITGLRTTLPPGFSLIVGAQTFTAGDRSPTLAPPLAIAPDGVATITARYAAPTYEPVTASIAFVSNAAPISVDIPINGPGCVTFDAASADLGPVAVGHPVTRTVTLRACDTASFLRLEAVTLDDPGRYGFALDLGGQSVPGVVAARTLAIAVVVAPVAAGPAQASLEVHANGGEASIQLYAQASAGR